MRVAGLGEESDATVIRETSHLCCFFPAGKSRCRHVAADLSRLKNQKLLDCLRKQGAPGLVKHEGWDEVTSVPTSRNLRVEDRDKPVRTQRKRAPTEADAERVNQLIVGLTSSSLSSLRRPAAASSAASIRAA